MRELENGAPAVDTQGKEIGIIVIFTDDAAEGQRHRTAADNADIGRHLGHDQGVPKFDHLVHALLCRMDAYGLDSCVESWQIVEHVPGELPLPSSFAV